jgi:hypothetical protein
MENQMIYSSYGADDNAITEPYFVDRDDDAYQDNIEVVDGEYHVINKVAVSASSPTCVVLAVDERLRDSVFRAVDVPVDDDDHRYNNNQAHAVEANALLRPTTRRLTMSSDTDFSSSSEDTEELASSSSSDSNDNSRRQRTLGIRRTASSIFRPLSGTKRHCVFEEYSHKSNEEEVDNDGDDSCIIPKMPSLCRAHRFGRSDEDQDCDEDTGKISLSSTYSFASAFKRICRSSSSSISSSTSQTTATSIVVMDESQSLEEEDVYQAGSKSTTRIAASAFEHLQHPLSSMLVATISSSVSSSIDEIVS